MSKSRYTSSVFINCPFDGEYIPIFNSILFTVFDCGYIPRCAQELDDSSEVRSEILRRYRLFISELPNLCGKLKLTVDEMTFTDYTSIIPVWLKQNP